MPRWHLMDIGTLDVGWRVAGRGSSAGIASFLMGSCYKVVSIPSFVAGETGVKALGYCRWQAGFFS